MKSHAVFIALLCLVINSRAEIRNGYKPDMESARTSLVSLRKLMDEDSNLSVFQRLQISTRIHRLTEFITYHDLTTKLLEHFRIISPELYFQIDSIKDGSGRTVQVYVKFVPEKSLPAGVAGATVMEQDNIDKTACRSEYGIGTVSVTIAFTKKSLFVLAHEFGHVKYQAPNMTEYQEYYTRFYLSNNYHFKSIGHNDKDASGRQALDYTRKFRQHYLTYKRGNNQKLEPYMLLIHRIRNGIEAAHTGGKETTQNHRGREQTRP